MDTNDGGVQPPVRLQVLPSWQISKISTLASRLTALRMPLSSRTDAAVLAALEESGPLSQVDLGRRLGLDRNDVNAVVNRLQAAGYVDRRTDPADRRRNIVSLQATGQVHLDKLLGHVEQVQVELLSGLTTRERGQLTALLAKVLAAHAAQPA